MFINSDISYSENRRIQILYYRNFYYLVQFIEDRIMTRYTFQKEFFTNISEEIFSRCTEKS